MAALLLYSGWGFNPAFHYFSGGIDVDHSFLLVDGGSKTLLAPRMNEREARARFRGRVLSSDDAFAELKQLLKGRKVRVDGASLSMRVFQGLRQFCRVEDFSDGLLRMRSVKRPEELAKIRKAVRLTKEILRSVDIWEARTEADARRMLLLAAMERGAEPAFDPIVATGVNSSCPHHVPGNAKLGRMALVDFGVRHEGYCADLSRCYFRERGCPEEKAYLKVKAVCREVLDAVPRLRTGKQAALFAAKAAERAGLPVMPHSIGHGIGLQVHEFPRLSASYSDPIRKGCAFTVEPGAYFARFGVRYEETAYFDGKKAIVL